MAPKKDFNWSVTVVMKQGNKNFTFIALFLGIFKIYFCIFL